MSRKLKIENFGPIESISIDLNNINIFTGQQCSGKSTIAKIISYCTWVEKNYATTKSHLGDIELDDFEDNLRVFHKLEGYKKEESKIEYISDILYLIWENGKANISKKNPRKYKRSKISYIPAERNFVVLPELKKVDLPKNNIRSFLFEWFEAQDFFRKKNNGLELLDLDIIYYYDLNTDKEMIRSQREKYSISFSESSSGIQSLVPLLVMVKYITEEVYEESSSFLRKAQESEALVKIISQIFEIEIKGGKDLNKIQQQLKKNPEDTIKKFDEFRKIQRGLFRTNNSQLIIEEPEMNLFPSTQRILVHHLIKSIQNGRDGNSLTITTHSPYILYAFNNCILSHLVKDKKEELNLRPTINPKDISIYEVEKGKVKCIQNEDGLLERNFLNEQMGIIMEDFYNLLELYD